MKNRLFLLAVGLTVMCSMTVADAAPVASGELFATYQKHGDRFYEGSGEADPEAPFHDWNISYYIVSCGDSMLLRATTTEDHTFNAGWQTQLRVWTNAYNNGNEIQTNAGGGTKDCYTSVGRKINSQAEDLKIHFFVDWSGNCTTEAFDFNRASINNPTDDATAPVIDPAQVSMDEEGESLVFTFGAVTADDAYFYYVGDADHHVGGISLENKVYITKPTVADGTTYRFKCYAVDYNGNKSDYKEFTLAMPFDPSLDLAYGKPCTAGAVQNDNTADRAVNGNPDQFWTSFGQGEESDWWWHIDLCNEYDVDSIMIHFNDVWGKYSILISSDDVNWTPVVADEQAEYDGIKEYAQVGKSGRYLKVTSTVSQIGIKEFKVFASRLTPTSGEEQGIIPVVSPRKSRKVMMNGMLYIEKDGVLYNILGVQK